MSNVNSRIRDYVNSLEADNKALRNELEALKGKTIGVDLSKDYMNKIKVHAIRGFANEMSDFENNSNGVNDRTVRLAEEYANKLEAGK